MEGWLKGRGEIGHGVFRLDRYRDQLVRARFFPGHNVWKLEIFRGFDVLVSAERFSHAEDAVAIYDDAFECLTWLFEDGMPAWSECDAGYIRDSRLPGLSSFTLVRMPIGDVWFATAWPSHAPDYLPRRGHPEPPLANQCLVNAGGDLILRRDHKELWAILHRMETAPELSTERFVPL